MVIGFLLCACPSLCGSVCLCGAGWGIEGVSGGVCARVFVCVCACVRACLCVCVCARASVRLDARVRV